MAFLHSIDDRLFGSDIVDEDSKDLGESELKTENSWSNEMLQLAFANQLQLADIAMAAVMSPDKTDSELRRIFPWRVLAFPLAFCGACGAKYLEKIFIDLLKPLKTCLNAT